MGAIVFSRRAGVIISWSVAAGFDRLAFGARLVPTKVVSAVTARQRLNAARLSIGYRGWQRGEDMRRDRSSIAPETAETLAVQAFAFVAEGHDRLASFLSATGLEPGGIRHAAQEPGFLAGVLEYILGDESLLIAFAQSAGIDPTEVARAAAALENAIWRERWP